MINNSMNKKYEYVQIDLVAFAILRKHLQQLH